MISYELDTLLHIIPATIKTYDNIYILSPKILEKIFHNFWHCKLESKGLLTNKCSETVSCVNIYELSIKSLTYNNQL